MPKTHATNQNRKALRDLQRLYQQRRQVVPGFPWEGVFQSRQEVDAYFAGAQIQCLLCGNWFKQISTSHLLRVHQMTPDAYRERYRLPWLRGLTGTDTHNKISAASTKAVAAGLMPWLGKHADPSKPNQSKSPRPCPPYMIRQKWQTSDYEAVLTRMQTQQRTLEDVCRDPDLPEYKTCRKFFKQHPELKARVQQIYASWPYAVQGRVRRELSPQFRIDCQQLRAQGLSYRKIAETLGVGIDTVMLTIRQVKRKQKR